MVLHGLCTVTVCQFFVHTRQRKFFKRYNIERVASSVGNPWSNFCAELSVKHLKKILRDIVGGTGSLDSDAVTQALLCHANTKCKVLKKSPAELAFGRCLKDFFPRNVDSLFPIPENFMSGEVKDELQGKIREDGGKRWSEHTRVLPDLNEADCVQLQNLKGRHHLKSDYNGIIVCKNNLIRVTVRNRATLRRILPPVPIHNLERVQNMSPVQSVPSAATLTRGGRQKGSSPLASYSSGSTSLDLLDEHI